MANEFQHKDPGTSLTQAEYITTDGTGHIFSCQQTGDILYASSTTVLKNLGKGAANTILNMGGSCIPAWTASPTVTDLTIGGGCITLTGAATDIDLIDNNASALSFDASGKTGIIDIVTTNCSEGVTMSGTLGVTGVLTATGGIELSHACQNTLTGSGGVLSIQGNRIFHAGGTDIPVADGGTGASCLTANGILVGNGTSAIQATATMATKGHVMIGDGSGVPTMLAVGSNCQVLTACSGEATGVKWAAAGGGAVSAVANGADNRIATFSSSDALNGEASLTFDSCDLKLSKTGAPEIHLEGTTIPRLYVTAYSSGGNAPEISLRRSDNATLGCHAAVDGCDNLGFLSFVGSDGDSYHTGAYIRGQATQTWSNTNYGGQLQFYTTTACAACPTLRLSLKCSGEIRIPAAQINLGDDTNTGMTTGITINQGASDNEILAFKSSDVNHGTTGAAESDTYGAFSKAATTGGLKIHGISNNCVGLNLRGGAGAATSTDTGASGSAIIFYPVIKCSASERAVDTCENAFGVTNGSAMRFLIKGGGDLHATDTAIESLDEHCDVGLIRTLETTTRTAGIIKSRWDDHVRENICSLIDAGLYSVPPWDGGLLNLSQLQRLHNGAIWQLFTLIKEQGEELLGLRQQLHALEGR